MNRITSAQALELLTRTPLAKLMLMADTERLKRHGRNTYFTNSLNINPTNVCKNRCRLCAYWREAEAPDAYCWTLKQAEERLRQARGRGGAPGRAGLTDLHIVGGVSDHLTLDYYENLFRTAKIILPGVCIQALTAVEINALSEQSRLPVAAVLRRLKAAGLAAIPGGGAEIFNPDIRCRICEQKISADTWLDIHAEAHRQGIPSNATMLFGHIESPEDIIDHWQRLRDLQDRTNGLAPGPAGFRAFIPIPFHPEGTRLGLDEGPSGYEIIRVTAVARLFLDNVPHIRMLANYVDRKLLQVLVRSGVDDLGGTSLDERIAKAAGAPDQQRFTAVEEMVAFITHLELEPVFVNSIYERAGKPEAAAFRTAPASGNNVTILAKAEAGERLTANEAVQLYETAPFQKLGKLADQARQQRFPGERATFVLDRNISLTNICVTECRFCAFHVKPGSANGFTLSIDEVVTLVKDAVKDGATQVLIQGGLNPVLKLDFYERLLSAVKTATGVWLHSLSPAEIVFLSRSENISIRETLQRLIRAGLNSLPGGGAEILVDDIRRNVSSAKITTNEWFDVMRTAHRLGMKSTATMVYGLGETMAQRIEHLIRVRDLQDETGGFTAFIPWSFQPNRTRLNLPAATGIDYLRLVAISRLVLDNVAHLQAGWVTEGPDLAQLALCFGADDFGGVLIEEKVVRETGTAYTVTRDRIVSLIRRAGRTPVQRSTQYDVEY